MRSLCSSTNSGYTTDKNKKKFDKNDPKLKEKKKCKKCNNLFQCNVIFGGKLETFETCRDCFQKEKEAKKNTDGASALNQEEFAFFSAMFDENCGSRMAVRPPTKPSFKSGSDRLINQFLPRSRSLPRGEREEALRVPKPAAIPPRKPQAPWGRSQAPGAWGLSLAGAAQRSPGPMSRGNSQVTQDIVDVDNVGINATLFRGGCRISLRTPT